MPHVLVQAHAAAPAGLQRERGEPLLFDEVAEHTVLHREELVRAVGGLAQPHHIGVGDHRAERAKVA
jgi:hypothetical protein